MATPARPIAICIVRWLYGLAHAMLMKLKEKLLYLIDMIDAQIAILRAILAQYDIIARVHKILWDLAQALIDEAKNQMQGVIPEAPENCPEVYEYLMDPFIILFDQSIGNLTLFKEKYADYVTYMDNVDRAIAYWDQTKADLLAVIDIIDDALYAASLAAAGSTP